MQIRITTEETIVTVREMHIEDEVFKKHGHFLEEATTSETLLSEVVSLGCCGASEKVAKHTFRVVSVKEVKGKIVDSFSSGQGQFRLTQTGSAEWRTQFLSTHPNAPTSPTNIETFTDEEAAKKAFETIRLASDCLGKAGT